MERLQFIKSLKDNLVARGFSEKIVDAEMVTVKSYLEDNGLTDVEVPVEAMADEIAEMLSTTNQEELNDSASAVQAPQDEVLPDSSKVTAPEDIVDGSSDMIDDEISSAVKKIESVKNKKHKEKRKRTEDNTFNELISDLDKINNEPSAPVDDDDVKVFSGSKNAPKPQPVDEEPFEDDISYVDSGENFEEFKPGGYKKTKTFDFGKITEKIKSFKFGEFWAKIKTFVLKIFRKKDENEDDFALEETEVTVRPDEKDLSISDEYSSPDKNNYDDKGKFDEIVENYENNKVLFWIVFAVALPIVIALSLFMVALYIAFWIALAVVMIAIVALLIAFVTAGVIIALVGIVYGTIQLIKGNTPVGMFEIGLGVTVGAAVMFIGIIVYNIAIRLIPFCMRMLAKLLAFAFRKGKDGFVALKGVLDRI